jgi:hypothetical protein
MSYLDVLPQIQNTTAYAHKAAGSVTKTQGQNHRAEVMLGLDTTGSRAESVQALNSGVEEDCVDFFVPEFRITLLLIFQTT